MYVPKSNPVTKKDTIATQLKETLLLITVRYLFLSNCMACALTRFCVWPLSPFYKFSARSAQLHRNTAYWYSLEASSDLNSSQYHHSCVTRTWCDAFAIWRYFIYQCSVNFIKTSSNPMRFCKIIIFVEKLFVLLIRNVGNKAPRKIRRCVYSSQIRGSALKIKAFMKVIIKTKNQSAVFSM